jgi:uncharacterized protein involved in type VI secretion and phage assembly
VADQVGRLLAQIAQLRNLSATAAQAAAGSPLRQLLEVLQHQAASVAAGVEQLTGGQPAPTGPSGEVAGLHRGVVVGGADPTGAGRVKVAVPAVTGAQELWAEVVRPVGSRTRSVPPAGTPVWVLHAAGDPSAPVVLGVHGT